jgi:hypothetical protein
MRRLTFGILVAGLLGMATVDRLEAQYLGLTQWTTGSGANGHWYAITESEGDFRVAETLAGYLGGYLVSIGSAQENQFVYSVFAVLGTCAPVWCEPSTFYIGLERVSSGGPFAWVSGEPLGFTAWNTGEPNDQGDERVAHMFAYNGQVLWNDIAYNSNPMRGVIEWTEDPTGMSTVPEPITLTLLGTGLMGIGAVRRWRKRQDSPT